MSRFSYSQDRFKVALQVLSGEKPDQLQGWPDTPNGRLRVAVIEVYACAPGDFALREHYDVFADLLLELRSRCPNGYALEAIRDLDAADCERFSDRLRDLARAVVAAFAVVEAPRSDGEATDGGVVDRTA